MNDLQQVLAGLSGPLIVLNPDETFDPARDHIIFNWLRHGWPSSFANDRTGTIIRNRWFRSVRLTILNLSLKSLLTTA
jgi:hypothetical protein